MDNQENAKSNEGDLVGFDLFQASGCSDFFEKDKEIGIGVVVEDRDIERRWAKARICDDSCIVRVIYPIFLQGKEIEVWESDFFPISQDDFPKVIVALREETDSCQKTIKFFQKATVTV